MSRLEEARRIAETRLGDLRASLERELGSAPRRKGLWMLVTAGAVGLALAMGAAARRRARRKKALPAGRGTGS